MSTHNLTRLTCLAPTDAQRTIQREDDVLYLVYDTAPPCGFRNVYWLQFTAEAAVAQGERDFFSLGALGFTHFRNGEVVEFSEIAEWVDEKRAFDHMTMMKGLQRIQQMLFFFSWKRKTVRNRHQRTRAYLACSLFACHPVAAQLLLKIRTVCTEVQLAAVCARLALLVWLWWYAHASFVRECFGSDRRARARVMAPAVDSIHARALRPGWLVSLLCCLSLSIQTC